MEKIFVLDTNVLIHDPEAMFHFADNRVVIPMTVIEEIDQFKKGVDDKDPEEWLEIELSPYPNSLQISEKIGYIMFVIKNNQAG